MSTLTLIRHGQGGRLGEDYDRLSPTGEAQARALGAYWSEQGLSFDEAYTGTLVRQRRTEELSGAELRAAGGAWPEVERLEGLNEYNADAVTSALLPELSAREPEFETLRRALEESADGPDRYKNFQKMLEAVLARWVRGDYESRNLEAWTTFRDRVRESLGSILRRSGGNRRVAVFTSGGPIGIAVAHALAAPDQSALEINWRVRNASVTEFVFSGRRISLDAYNSITHLRDPALWTFR